MVDDETGESIKIELTKQYKKVEWSAVIVGHPAKETKIDTTLFFNEEDFPPDLRMFYQERELRRQRMFAGKATE